MSPVNDAPLRSVCLAFLAERSPGAYTVMAIQQRLSRSGLLDAPPSIIAVSEALRLMGQERLGYVDASSDHSTGDICWYATEPGRRRWALDGQMHVE